MKSIDIFRERTLDAFLFDIEALTDIPELSNQVRQYLDGDYSTILRSPTCVSLCEIFAETIFSPREKQDALLRDSIFEDDLEISRVLVIGLSAFNAFLQDNVTGPPLQRENLFPEKQMFRERCLRSLDVDGVSVYQYIPHIEFFCLARYVFTVFFPRIVENASRDCKWMRLRVNAYHQRLLSGCSGGRLSDSTLLHDLIERDLVDLDEDILRPRSLFTIEAKVQYLLEKAQVHIIQGQDIKSKDNLKMATAVSGFNYALSGALGKKTKFQQNDISQLVVLAKSAESGNPTLGSTSPVPPENPLTIVTAPNTLRLNDDTLLESVLFTKNLTGTVTNSTLPPELADLQPDNQPQLNPLDQITLLTEATLKEKFSPLDNLNEEEILPYAVRVLNDKPTNWQIYTQALLVRSRIESHNLRTQERSVLQLQVIVNQIIADTQGELSPADPNDVPEIKVTSFLPKFKANESAPVQERLKYIYPLNTPTRWEIETELAFAWSNAGSLISALEIFKRLQMWAEVALCYYSAGQEDRARQIIRRQLYFSDKGDRMDEYDIDAPETTTEKWEGGMRPTPPHAPRLWCILGDLENDPSCWERAWEISKRRYARAQRTLGEYYVKSGYLEKAREAYMQASIVNRHNGDTWSRLGDIDLKLGNWGDAVVAFQQAIMLDDTDAKTYSNLGSALISKHAEINAFKKAKEKDAQSDYDSPDEDFKAHRSYTKVQDPKECLTQALKAYKRAASLAHSNWQIWDNVLTIGLRLSPPSYGDVLLGMRNVLRIRKSTLGESAIDIDVLRLLVAEVIRSERLTNHDGGSRIAHNGVYTPPHGTLALATLSFINEDILPLVTTRAEIYELAEKMALYRSDYAAALAFAEKSWRVQWQHEEWLVDEKAWHGIVASTFRLVDALESYGSMKMASEPVESGWRTKARRAISAILGKAKDSWESSLAWEGLRGRLDDLKG